jgi:hypothetical protein
MFGGTSNLSAYQSIGFRATTDGVWSPAANGADGRIHFDRGFRFSRGLQPQLGSTLVD